MTHAGSIEQEPVRSHHPDAELVAASEAVRILLRSRLRDADSIEDLHQEAMERVLRVRARLDPDAIVPYAVTVAKNLIAGGARRRAVSERNQHRLLEHRDVEAPDEHLLREEDRLAITAALDSLSGDAREELVAHVLEGRSTIDLADEAGGSPGGVAARLARSRARMRLDYLVAVRGVTLPTPDCHPVLLTFSAADRRRQVAIGATDHILRCDVCKELAPPLLERRRALVGLVPVPALAPLLAAVARLARRHSVQAGVAVGMIAVGAAAVVAGQSGPDPQSAATPRPSPTVPTTSAPPSTTGAPAPGRVVVAGRAAVGLMERGALAQFAGQPVRADRALVESVSADEGFWLASGGGRRVWVQLLSPTGSPSPTESPVDIREGQRVSFLGRLAAHGDDFPGRAGLDRADGSDEIAELAAAGAHVEVEASGIVVTDG